MLLVRTVIGFVILWGCSLHAATLTGLPKIDDPYRLIDVACDKIAILNDSIGICYVLDTTGKELAKISCNPGYGFVQLTNNGNVLLIEASIDEGEAEISAFRSDGTALFTNLAWDCFWEPSETGVFFYGVEDMMFGGTTTVFNNKGSMVDSSYYFGTITPSGDTMIACVIGHEIKLIDYPSLKIRKNITVVGKPYNSYLYSPPLLSKNVTTIILPLDSSVIVTDIPSGKSINLNDSMLGSAELIARFALSTNGNTIVALNNNPMQSETVLLSSCEKNDSLFVRHIKDFLLPIQGFNESDCYRMTFTDSLLILNFYNSALYDPTFSTYVVKYRTLGTDNIQQKVLNGEGREIPNEPIKVLLLVTDESKKGKLTVQTIEL